MSYRELRSFTETMRALGYPRPISVDNFRTPNFGLVAEILLWLVERYDPSASVPESIETEAARVAFLTSIANVMAAKARLLLKTKNLYAADGRAVKEMLKIARTLYAAMRACGDAGKGEEDDPQGAEDFTFSIRPAEVVALRGAATEITERGAKLFELLKREGELKDARASALRFLETVSGSLDARSEHEYIERSVRDSISGLKDSMSSMERQVSELTEDERSLEAKLNKKQQELARLQKRLESLSSVRPAFMDEYEKLERELADEYEAYITRYRNLQYLEHELQEYNKREKTKMEASNRALRKLQKRLKEEEFKAFRGDENVADDDGGAPDSRERTPVMRAGAQERGRDPAPRPGMGMAGGRPPLAGGAAGASRGSSAAAAGVAGGRLSSAGGGPRVVGRMDGPADDDEESEEEDDEDLDDDEEGDEGDDDGLDDDDEGDDDDDGDFE